jgi:ferritin-like metal-binding protein YciE
LLQVVTDPRTSIAQSLHAIHIAELADNDGWVMLIDLAEQMGQTDLVTAFTTALRHEEEHLALVRRWMRTATQSLAAMSQSP